MLRTLHNFEIEILQAGNHLPNSLTLDVHLVVGGYISDCPTIMAPRQAMEKMAFDEGDHSSLPFPWKLHRILEAAEEENYTDIVSWLPGDKAFRVHNHEHFVEKIMPRHFQQTQYKSFQRQLNLWGFRTQGKRKGGYSHEHFLRGKPNLCHLIKRKPRRRPAGRISKKREQRPSSAFTPASYDETFLEDDLAKSTARRESSSHDFAVLMPPSSLQHNSFSFNFELFDEDTLSSVLPPSMFSLRWTS